MSWFKARKRSSSMHGENGKQIMHVHLKETFSLFIANPIFSLLKRKQ